MEIILYFEDLWKSKMAMESITLTYCPKTAPKILTSIIVNMHNLGHCKKRMEIRNLEFGFLAEKI
jgi:hypothetical protein